MESLQHIKELGLKKTLLVRSQGIEVFHFALHSVSPRLHDHYMGERGAFLALVAACKNVHALGKKIDLTIPMYRSTLSEGKQLAKLCDQLHIAQVTFTCAGYETSGLYPRLAHIKEDLSWMRTELEAVGVVVVVEDIPLCIQGDTTDYAASFSQGVYVAECEGCTLREKCLGIDPKYIEYFGEEEVIPFR